MLLLAVPLPVSGQAADPDSRAEALRQEREKKEQELKPNEPDALQRGMAFAESRGLFLTARDGFHPKLGTLTTGSGFAMGVGYRTHSVFDRYGLLELWTAGSLKKYWASEVRATFPALAQGRVRIEGLATIREYPREAFFGLGPDSQRADQTSFALRTAEVSTRVGARVAPPILVGGGLGFLRPKASPDARDSARHIFHVFEPNTIPGLGMKTDYIRSSAFVEVDYRQPRNARRGGWYRIDFGHFEDRNNLWSFGRADVDLQQFIGVFADRRVIALRGWFSSTTPAEDSLGVPFYLMPTLGGNDTLRGFRNYRFRGPHALLLQAEYRWELWSGLDAALFYDAGKVGMQRADLGLNGLQSDYGFGFRFNTANGVVLRVDAAFGSRDGKHLHIVFGGVF